MLRCLSIVFFMSCISCKTEKPKEKYWISIQTEEGPVQISDTNMVFNLEDDTTAYILGFHKYNVQAIVYSQSTSPQYLRRPLRFTIRNKDNVDIVSSIPDSIKYNSETNYLKAIQKEYSNVDSVQRIIDSKDRLAYLTEFMLMSSLKARLDTLGLFMAPIKVISSSVKENEYSSFRDISLAFKNISDKRINGVKFKWYAITAFNEPADMGNPFVDDGIGQGFTDHAMLPNKIDYGTFSTTSSNAKKIVLAWPTEVAFADGTKWELKH